MWGIPHTWLTNIIMIVRDNLHNFTTIMRDVQYKVLPQLWNMTFSIRISLRIRIRITLFSYQSLKHKHYNCYYTLYIVVCLPQVHHHRPYYLEGQLVQQSLESLSYREDLEILQDLVYRLQENVHGLLYILFIRHEYR